MRIAFAVHGVLEADLERVEFYRQDVEILRSLGHEVYWTANPLYVRPKTDLIFCWWWTYAWRAILSGLIHRVPVIVTGVFDLPLFASRPWPQRQAMSIGARLASANVFVSEYEFKGVRAALKLERADFSPLVVDGQIYLPSTAGRAGSTRFTIANVSWKRTTNMRRKMLPELVQAMRSVVQGVPDARLVLAGPPEDGERILRSMVEQFGLTDHVEFRGELTVKEKVQLFRDCDIYVQCSRYEGFGLAIAEAMACGAPVIVTPVPPVVEVVGECGLFVDPATPEAIAEAIVGLAHAPEQRTALSLCGTKRVSEQFSKQRRRSDLERIIGRVTIARSRLPTTS